MKFDKWLERQLLKSGIYSSPNDELLLSDAQNKCLHKGLTAKRLINDISKKNKHFKARFKKVLKQLDKESRKEFWKRMTNSFIQSMGYEEPYKI